jgi:thymidylate synthase (FAD)
MKVNFISKTQPCIEGVDTAEQLIAYCARVSNPGNQHNNDTAPKLLQFLIKNHHWSPFEMVNMCVSVETSRAIAAQILRHRSFSFQEFSQRYAAVDEDAHENVEIRRAGTTNRQSSTVVTENADELVSLTVKSAFDAYQTMLDSGVATETARMVLPLCTKTKLYMNGTLRSWVHYLQIRCDDHVQKEHREIADAIREILKIEFPTVFQAVFTTGEGHCDTRRKN